MAANLQGRSKILLSSLIILATIPFFFVHSSCSYLGISLFAWLLVVVMVITPLLTLVDLLIFHNETQENEG